MLNRRDFIKFSIFLFGSNLFANTSKSAIVYYSRTLNTHIFASFISMQTGAKLFRIQTKDSYPKDYDEMVKLAYLQKQNSIFPKLETKFDLSQFDTIFLGVPLWSLDICAPVKSFLVNSDLNDKTIIPFISNAGWSIDMAVKSIKNLCDANVLDAYSFVAKFKEKTKRDLAEFNTNLIANDEAFLNLEKEAIKKWLQNS
ncbi:flavodoxin domain protein [Campylobacter iguaniorum]|uniref:Flavodoxin domain protein n=1 Tax=Campylobacter iguaniorum TaxID=1244531 RepID=A0A076FCY6_9BACT|nr:flavodoxin [Campylobacter iguaniorum]AII15498.1 flavodoxin domain protein [Campylobacter iguaniorum]